MNRYEYKVVVVGQNHYGEALNRNGREGWMFVGMKEPQTPLGHDAGTVEITFQRELPSREDLQDRAMADAIEDGWGQKADPVAALRERLDHPPIEYDFHQPLPTTAVPRRRRNWWR